MTSVIFTEKRKKVFHFDQREARWGKQGGLLRILPPHLASKETGAIGRKLRLPEITALEMWGRMSVMLVFRYWGSGVVVNPDWRRSRWNFLQRQIMWRCDTGNQAFQKRSDWGSLFCSYTAWFGQQTALLLYHAGKNGTRDCCRLEPQSVHAPLQETKNPRAPSQSSAGLHLNRK